MKSTGDRIISEVKDNLDGRWLGLQSYFNKEEIIAKMGELHADLMMRVEVVGRRSFSSLQDGNAGHHPDAEVTMMIDGVSASDVFITNPSALTIVEPSCGRKFQFFFFCRQPFTCSC